MWNLIVEESPYMIAAMLAAPIVLVLSGLIAGKAERPVRSTSIFVLGAVILDLIFAAVILWLLHVVGISSEDNISAWIDTLLGVLFLVIGIKAAIDRPTEEEKATQRARMEKIAAAKATSLLLAGVLVQIVNADALAVFGSGLKEIAITTPYPTAATIVVVVLVFLFVMLVPYHLPIWLYVASPEKAGGKMRAMSAWLLDHAQALEVVVGLGFGALFLFKGLTALL